MARSQTRSSAASWRRQRSVLWVKMESLLPKEPLLGVRGGRGGAEGSGSLGGGAPGTRSCQGAPRWVARGVGQGQSVEKGSPAPESHWLPA